MKGATGCQGPATERDCGVNCLEVSRSHNEMESPVFQINTTFNFSLYSYCCRKMAFGMIMCGKGCQRPATYNQGGVNFIDVRKLKKICKSTR